ncbi:MAG: BolA family transcriptional regulator [Alphaproteobacteria bacterium]|nr:BolA family transcriptional regulator [Alphaproteobacteria bacterium]
MTIAETIRTKLEAAFAPEKLDVRDESEMHRGHAGHREGGETHFRVAIVSATFEGLSRIDRHRKVHAVLDAELRDRVHALALTLLTPEEAAHRM